MKVNLKDKEIQSYVLSIEIEVEGELYRADLDYDIHNGYEVTFYNQKGEPIGYPKWAQEYEGDDSLGYWLENQIGGWFEWAPEKEGNK